MLSKLSVIAVLPMLTVQPVLPWPMDFIMISSEFNYFGVFVVKGGGTRGGGEVLAAQQQWCSESQEK